MADLGEDLAPATGPTPAGPRLRIRFSKLGKIRFTSHRDVARMWERALRRSGLSVAYSEGFSPRPLLSFGLALPTGCESLAEYLDVRLTPGPGTATTGRVGFTDADDQGVLADALSALLPEGLTVTALAPLAAGSGSLQQEVTSCTWELEVLGAVGEDLAARVEQLLGATSVLIRRERKGRQVEDDLRPSVLALRTAPGLCGSEPAKRSEGWLRAELATRPRGVRPEELLQGLGEGLSLARARRTHQWIENGGTRTEPLPVGEWSSGSAERAMERAL